MIQLPKMPSAIARLPRDHRGYPVPWFVHGGEKGGVIDFRVADAEKMRLAIRESLCWVCGGRLNRSGHVFVIGPMCGVNRTTAEPPCHAECAIFSVKACPFLSRPKAVRRGCDVAIDESTAGVAITRNPGVTALWHCRGYSLFSDGKGGILFRIPSPRKVQWFREGRPATRAEILESVDSGIPILYAMAQQDGPQAIAELNKARKAFERYLPSAA